MSPLDTLSLLGLRSRISFAAQSGHMAAAALRRHAVGLQQALARLSSTVSGAWQPHRVIPAEVAQLVSLRGGMTALPPDIVAAVDQAAAGESAVAASSWQCCCNCIQRLNRPPN